MLEAVASGLSPCPAFWRWALTNQTRWDADIMLVDKFR